MRLTRCVFSLFVAILLVFPAAAADSSEKLGATLRADGTTVFRVWAPFVDAVAVNINGSTPVAMTKEVGHPNADDTVWKVVVPSTHAGDSYRYAVQCNGATREFNDPYAQQLTGFSPPDGFGISGHDDKPQSVIVDQAFDFPAFNVPSFNTIVIYEMHLGTFNNDFAGAIAKLDYLQQLGINAVEVMPITQNPLFSDHTPTDHDWGYDPVQLFAIKSKYGKPTDFKEFVKQCHLRHIAVIVDVVYNHLVGNNLLNRFGGFSLASIPNGIYLYGDDRVDTGFGPRPDFGRPQVRQYIADNALTLLRDYDVDGLRFDDTRDIRTYAKGNGREDNAKGIQLLREINAAYRTIAPEKLSIAEDLQSYGEVVNSTDADPAALEFNSQWDDTLFYTVRRAMVAVNDQDRNLQDIKRSLELKLNNDVFSRVIYTENHDKVGHPDDSDKQTRLPALIDVNDPESVFAKRRSTLAAGILLTAPGIPMLFQGQEMLDTRAFGFKSRTPVDFSRAVDPKYRGIVQLYRDLIALRRNVAGKSRGLTGQNLNVFHIDDGNKTLAYHRWENGGAGDDVVVVANFSNNPQAALNIGFPRGGLWRVRFNSGAKVYDSSFENGDSFDTVANAGGKDGLNFNANVGIGPYSIVVLSQ